MSPTLSRMGRRPLGRPEAAAARRAGFTLVEMLVVILIIGILAAILIPTVTAVIRQGRQTVLAVEVSQLDQAMTEYKNKYTDYPPDFTDYNLALRHIRKAFPRISADEIAHLHNNLIWNGGPGPMQPGPFNTPLSRIDKAEAIVFWLGGLSEDPRHPFTGPGGPILVLGTAAARLYAANPERNKGFMEFDQARFPVYLADLTNSNAPDPINGQMMSRDEVDLHGGTAAQNDPFPVYMAKQQDTPYVYFDSRTYTFRLDATNWQRNQWTAAAIQGVARPYRSDQVNPNRTDPTVGGFLFDVNKDSFQIICAGLDDDFGQGLGRFKTGYEIANMTPVGTGYQDGDLDNVTNFSEGRSLQDNKP